MTKSRITPKEHNEELLKRFFKIWFTNCCFYSGFNTSFQRVIESYEDYTGCVITHNQMSEFLNQYGINNDLLNVYNMGLYERG